MISIYCSVCHAVESMIIPEMVLVAVELPLHVEVMPTPWNESTAGVKMTYKVQSTQFR